MSGGYRIENAQIAARASIAIMAPTFVVSVFFMNVTLPFGLREHPAFWIIMGLTGLYMVGFFIFWKYKKW